MCVRVCVPVSARKLSKLRIEYIEEVTQDVSAERFIRILTLFFHLPCCDFLFLQMRIFVHAHIKNIYIHMHVFKHTFWPPSRPIMRPSSIKCLLVLPTPSLLHTRTAPTACMPPPPTPLPFPFLATNRETVCAHSIVVTKTANARTQHAKRAP